MNLAYFYVIPAPVGTQEPFNKNTINFDAGIYIMQYSLGTTTQCLHVNCISELQMHVYNYYNTLELCHMQKYIKPTLLIFT